MDPERLAGVEPNRALMEGVGPQATVVAQCDLGAEHQLDRSAQRTAWSFRSSSDTNSGPQKNHRRAGSAGSRSRSSAGSAETGLAVAATRGDWAVSLQCPEGDYVAKCRSWGRAQVPETPAIDGR